MPPDLRYPPIEDHGVVGDLHTVALVAVDGTIDFLCFPRFDSPSVFASLLDAENGGSFRLAPVFEEANHRQLYLPNSNVLLTRFLSDEGVAEISDFMPVEEVDQAHTLVRRVKTIRGEVRYRMSCRPRFDYGRASHRTEPRDDGSVLFESRGEDGTALVLHASVPVEIRDGDAFAEFTLGADESAQFVLEKAPEGRESRCCSPDYVTASFKATLNFWRYWVGRSTYRGRWQEVVNRSALTVKLLFSRELGSMVAAPTFGLPEIVGGERNWDYRYTWIRDASFMLYALSRLGYTEEAKAFMGWIEGRCEQADVGGRLQIMYALDGTAELPETELGHLEGYRGSRPVRIGNAAYRQLQLDIYGELMDAVYLYDRHGEQISIDLWGHVKALLAWLEENWRQPDDGIWEFRGGRHHFIGSRVMCWVAFDRAIRLAQRRGLPSPLSRWHEVRDRIHRDLIENFWSPERRAFMQIAGGKGLDAASLLLPLTRFIGATDPMWLSSIDAIREELVRDSLVHRYRIDGDVPDGLEGKEGTFSMCSFWWAEVLSRAGDVRQARLAFEKMLGYANHLGLYAEELGARGEHLGNFPQALTHMGLISAAYELDRRLESKGVQD